MGAFGLPQFLPSSVLSYGVDADGNGQIDLFMIQDAIFSTANFLVNHGYHKNKYLAFSRYYGSSRGYPRAVTLYASALSLVN
jgi:membrane-bound lytic murein transglycosylase B